MRSAASRTSPSAARPAAMRVRTRPVARVNISLLPALPAAARLASPFEPKSDRPVYCSECFAKMRAQQG